MRMERKEETWKQHERTSTPAGLEQGVQNKGLVHAVLCDVSSFGARRKEPSRNLCEPSQKRQWEEVREEVKDKIHPFPSFPSPFPLSLSLNF